MKAILALLLLLTAVAAHAQFSTPATGITGQLHITADDTAKILLNGQPIHTAAVPISTSPEITLKPGDRLVAQVSNAHGLRRMKMIFVSTDRRWVISFGKLHYRLLDLTMADFSATDWGKMTRRAKVQEPALRDPFTVRNTADWVWGEADTDTLGVLIGVELFKPLTATAAVVKDEGPIVLTVEALVDGPSTLHVRKDGLLWLNGGNAKPGLGREPTFVDDQPWMPTWGAPDRPRGADRTTLHPLTLPSLELKVELVGNMEKRGVEGVDTSRSKIEVGRRGDALTVTIPDPQSGARWYKLVFRGRKK